MRCVGPVAGSVGVCVVVGYEFVAWYGMDDVVGFRSRGCLRVYRCCCSGHIGMGWPLVCLVVGRMCTGRIGRSPFGSIVGLWCEYGEPVAGIGTGNVWRGR